MRILHLTLKRRWFQMIAKGEKKEEYRELKPYWINRFIEINYPKEQKDDHKNIPENIIFDIRENGFDWSKVVEAYHSKTIEFDLVKFKNGYGKNSPEMEVEFMGITTGRGKSEWGGDHRRVLIIKLGKILSIKNYNP